MGSWAVLLVQASIGLQDNVTRRFLMDSVLGLGRLRFFSTSDL